MPHDLGTALRHELRSWFHAQKELAERALAQTPPDAFFSTLDEDANSIGLIVKHVGGNLRSRWRDFLTSDGEKADRRRDREFEHEAGDSVESVLARWNDGWAHLFNALDGLSDDDLLRVVHIGGEGHTVVRAALRSLAHTAQHVGQIVLLARHAAGRGWKTLSIPRGGSDAHLRDTLDRRGR